MCGPETRAEGRAARRRGRPGEDGPERTARRPSAAGGPGSRRLSTWRRKAAQRLATKGLVWSRSRPARVWLTSRWPASSARIARITSRMLAPALPSSGRQRGRAAEGRGPDGASGASPASVCPRVDEGRQARRGAREGSMRNGGKLLGRSERRLGASGVGWNGMG